MTDVTDLTGLTDLCPSALLARVIVDELIRQGVSQAVLCPGSRSTPLAFALAEAEEEGRLTLHIRVDERAAGFLALGLSAQSDAPVIVSCTSGSAVANLHPAAVEARYQHQRIIFLTANRPPEMHGVGAQQTIEHRGIFAHDVVDSLELASPQTTDNPEATNAHWRSALSRIMARSAHQRGPVHIDAHFREPLLSPADVQGTHLPPLWQGRAGHAPWTAVAPHHGIPTVDLSLPTLVIAGQGSWDIPQLAQVPTLVEPGGRTASTHILHPLSIGDEDSPLQQSLHTLIVVGRPTLHRGVTRLLARHPRTIVMAPPHALTEWADVPGTATAVASTLQVEGTVSPDWLELCHAAHTAATQHVRSVLQSASSSGIHVAQGVGDALCALPPQDRPLLLVGSSNPVRDLALTHPSLGPFCHVNRGCSGIDGLVSTSMGLALAAQRPVVAYLGDLSALHDATGFLIPTLEQQPPSVTVIVANDEGGGIFATLEPGQDHYRTMFERLFGTPHTADFAALARTWGWEYQRATSHDLPSLLSSFPPGLRLIEVRTQRQDRHQLARVLAATTGARTDNDTREEQ